MELASRILEYAGGGLLLVLVLAVVGYLGLVVMNRRRYGQAERDSAADRSPLLDRFIAAPEVVEHHQVQIAAPADVVLTTATEMELLSLPIVRAVIRARELAMGGQPDTRPHPQALLAQMLSIGWVVLAERRGHEIALGAVTQPWQAAPVFRSIAAADFAAFAEPGYVKIAWSLRAEAVNTQATQFHVETRVSTSDPACRARFRRYWSYVAPGVGLIRLAMLRPLKKEAERRAATVRTAGVSATGATSPSERRAR